MTSATPRSIAVICGIAACLLSCSPSGEAPDGHGGKAHDAKESVRGPHGGRLLRDGDFAVELAIYEKGVPPEYRAWFYDGDEVVDPGSVDFAVELARFGERKDVFHFTQRDDYLLGDKAVEEPHSFVVTVRARRNGKAHEWRYESFEGRTKISAENAKAAGIRVEPVAPARIRTRMSAVGRVTANADALARIVPRYPGVIREARKRIGDAVAKGEVVAVVEASQTLQSYELRSPTAGTIVSRNAATGEVTADAAIYTVANLSTVWVDLLLKPADAARVRAGAAVEVSAGELRATSTIDYVAPTVASETQAAIARATVGNAGGGWRPGLFVTAEIVVDETEVPIAVQSSALQTFRDWDVVFLNDGDVYQAMPVELGRRDGDRVEILEGLQTGQRYAADGSFVVKADIEKSGATHDH